MTVQRLPRLNSPKQILWLGCNLLSRELQTNSQIAASVQNTLSVQETNLSSAFYVFFFYALCYRYAAIFQVNALIPVKELFI